jgi:predicted O-linked N-acetylglucosamine transferase (SPINDLY family)
MNNESFDKEEAAADAINAAVTSYFALAGQGTLEIIDLINAVERMTVAGLKDETISLYRLWLEHSTSSLAYLVYFNLGVALGSGRDYLQAEAMYRKALEQNPGFIEGRINLGNCLEQLKRDDEALEQWRAALELPQITLPANKSLQLHALNNLGRLLETKRQFQEALSMLNTSFALDPTQRDVLYHMVHLREKICTWPVIQPPEGITKSKMIEGSSPLAMLALVDDPALQLFAAQQFVERKYTAERVQLAPAGGYNHDKIRIGYLSSDLSTHAVSLLTVELFELHDRERFEVYGFCWSREDGTPFRQRVISAMDHFIRIGELGDKEAAETILAHEIDIIVDLHGLTSGARPLILAQRPAPLQITYLGFPGPTGLPWIDYVIADRYLIPDQLTQYFTEKPLYLPHCFQVSDSKREVAPKPSRADYFLPEDAFVFCAFNNNYKYTPEMFAIWMSILRRVPKSVLWLLADNEWAHGNLVKEAKKHGIKKGRLIFASRVVPADYLARYQIADLFLDTFPFNGGTTANDALFMGLPLLTLSGRTFASRMAGSLLTNLRLPELITSTMKDYEETAVALAKEPKRLASIRSKLKESCKSGKTFNIPAVVQDYESALINVLREGLPHPGPAAEAGVDASRVHEVHPVTPGEVLNLLNLIRPWHMADDTKIRIGPDADGGYVLPSCSRSSSLVFSIGIGNEVGFDTQMAKLGAKILQFEHSFERAPLEHPNIRFLRQGWGARDGGEERLISLRSMISQADWKGVTCPILKIRANGAEWEALEAADPADLGRFEVITGEFHDFTRLIDREYFDRVHAVFSKLAGTHNVVHMHANNAGGLFVIGGIPFPKLLELTFLRKGSAVFSGHSSEPIPGPFDRPNVPFLPDLYLRAF